MKAIKSGQYLYSNKGFRYHRFGKDENGIDRDERAAYWTTLTAKINQKRDWVMNRPGESNASFT